MRNSPVTTLDPAQLDDAERALVVGAVSAIDDSGVIDFDGLPDAVKAQVFMTLRALAHGNAVASVVSKGKPLTTTEAAEVLGMSRSYLMRLCDEGRIPNYRVGTARRIDADVVTEILAERTKARSEAVAAAETAEDRRLARAARRAGLDLS